MHRELNYDPTADRYDSERYQETKQELEATSDSPVDLLIEEIHQRASNYAGREHAYAGESFAKIVATIARAALTLEAISGIIVHYVEEQTRTIKMDTIRAILSIVKSEKPHLTIDVIEFVFGLSKDSESSIARKHSIDRQVVSKRVVKMRNQFGITPQRKLETAEIYRNNRLEQYERARERIREIQAI